MNKDQLAVNTLRINGTAAVNKANSGHPGIVLGAAPIMHTLFSRHIMTNPSDPKFINRDRFVLAAGHGSALLYAQLRLLGLIKQEDLENFRQLDSLTPGHPEYGHTKGVDSTSGPLGQGIATATGMALAEELLRNKFSEISHYTYALCGDGDLQEGVAMEAASFAGRQKLSKLIVLHDSNDIQLDTEVKSVFNEDLKQKFESMHWDYQLVEENTVENIDAAIKKAKASDKPSFIEVKSIIGEGATAQGTSGVHGAPVGDDFVNVKKYYDWTHEDFEVPAEVKELYNEVISKNVETYDSFKASSELEEFMSNGHKLDFKLDIDKNIATRASSGEVIKYINKNDWNWVGGSADLVASTKAQGGDGNFDISSRNGRNILFGVREFAMGAIANGLALHSNFRPFVSTFFVFSDYMKPAIRLASLMKLPVTYIFTHDSIFVGEDGPTHEPIEQLAMLRSTPGLTVIRPADEKEVKGAYKEALETMNPTVIVLTRQNIKSSDLTKTDISKGAYIVKEGNDTTIVATGSELSLALEVASETGSTVVSMPSMELFRKQSEEYKNSVIKDWSKTLTIEIATTFGWKEFGKYNYGTNEFGLSAPGDLIYKRLGFTKENIIKEINKIN